MEIPREMREAGDGKCFVRSLDLLI